MRPGYFVSTPTSLTYYATRREAVLAASLVPEASVIREAEDAPGVPAGKRDERATAAADRLRAERESGKALNEPDEDPSGYPTLLRT